MRKFYPYLRDAYLSNSTKELQQKNFLIESYMFKLHFWTGKKTPSSLLRGKLPLGIKAKMEHLLCDILVLYLVL